MLQNPHRGHTLQVWIKFGVPQSTNANWKASIQSVSAEIEKHPL